MNVYQKTFGKILKAKYIDGTTELPLFELLSEQGVSIEQKTMILLGAWKYERAYWVKSATCCTK